MSIPLLVITGSLGAGKTAVLGEAADVLAERSMSYAAIDFDWLCEFGPRADPFGASMGYRNLAAIWPNYAEAGVERVMIAAVIEHRDELRHLTEAVPGARPVVCRLIASLDVMRGRVAARDPGRLRDWLMHRSGEVDAIQERNAVADFSVDNDDRPIGAVAEDVLAGAGWI